MMPRFHTLLGAVLLCACAQSALADDYVWRNVKVGGGGYIPGIEFSQVARGLAYLRSDMGGIYRWDDKQQQWLPLQDGSPEQNYRGIESLAPDPVNGDVVYAAVGTYRNGPSAILRSSDRGDHWETFPVPFKMGGNEEGRGLGERLAVDPNLPSLLYFGTRYDGLQRSTDRGATWHKVGSFPVAGLPVPPPRQRPHAGLSFVVIDAASGGAPSRTIFVGVADPGAHHLYRSDDAGAHWAPVSGEPRADFLPAQAQLANGILYISYANSMGPYGVSDGAVFKLDTHTGVWTDITPETGPNKPAGGYMGLSLDRQQPNTLIVASIDRGDTGDILWRSIDGGAHWQNLRALSTRDVSSTPFLLWGEKEASFGWWMTGVAIDPFDSGHAAYTTGATVYATSNLADAAENNTVLWKPWVDGIEQTAVLALLSPASGAPLISAFGDIGGFTHADLDRSMPIASNPMFTNTNNLDYAERAPNVIVRSGTHAAHGVGRTATLGYSLDSGKTWQPLFAPYPKGYQPPEPIPYNFSDPYTDAAITVSADGSTFAVSTPEPVITTDRGHSWISVKGAPPDARLVPDRADAQTFYAVDFARARILVSHDGGRSFKALNTRGLPKSLLQDQPHWREVPWPLLAAPTRKGDLWFVSREGLFHSTDGGYSFAQVKSDVAVLTMDFGKPAPGHANMTLFAIGKRGREEAIWRSLDDGGSWIRVNDAAHEYGHAFRCIAADKNVFGRVYVGTDGRGIVYGEPR